MIYQSRPCNGIFCIILVNLVFLMMTIGTVASPDWADCPAPCLCKWTYGKKSAFCASSNLTAIPSLNSELQVLDLQHNRISYLTKDQFSALGLLNLQKIFLKGTSLREIHRDAFRDLKILIEVDLSNNHISVIPRDTFAGNERLRVLILSGNPLKQLFNEQFPILPHLRTLELENCQLSTLARDSFVHLDQLEKLNLRNNELQRLSESVFAPTAALKSLSLEANPWRCDCSLRTFRNWYLASKLHSVSLSCAEPPRLKGRIWEDIAAAEFACAPEVRITDRMIREHAGGNVTFGCHVRGDPEPEVTWYFRGYPIGTANATHPEQMLILEIEEGLVDKWVNVSVFNLTKADAGEYACAAKNFLSRASDTVSLYVQQEMVVVTLGKTETVRPMTGLVGGGVFSVALVAAAAAFACVLFLGLRRRRSRNRRKGRIKDSASFAEQDKKLLDASIATSTAERRSCGTTTQSLEMFGSCQSDMTMKACGGFMPDSRSSINVDAELPAQIAVHREMLPMAAAYPAATFGLDYAGPRLVPTGNIFISVSVSKDQQQRAYVDGDRYPDLLEISCQGPSPFCGGVPVSTYATLPRKPRGNPPMGPLYDRLGRRVTMQGSSTLSLPDAQNEEDAAGNNVESRPAKEPPITLEVDEYVSL